MKQIFALGVVLWVVYIIEKNKNTNQRISQLEADVKSLGSDAASGAISLAKSAMQELDSSFSIPPKYLGGTGQTPAPATPVNKSQITSTDNFTINKSSNNLFPSAIAGSYDASRNATIAPAPVSVTG